MYQFAQVTILYAWKYFFENLSLLKGFHLKIEIGTLYVTNNFIK